MTDDIRTSDDEIPHADGERDSDAIDVVDGPVGSATLREPSEVEREGLGADPDSLPTPD